MKQLVSISRILVGVLFIISGLIKANDALGFSYKLDEYFVVFSMQFLSGISVGLAMFICIFEVALGVALLVGYRMVCVSWLMLLMIVFFTFLTFYSAYFDVVKDCGCFGDALKLKPWESFYKDVALLAFILIIFAKRKSIKPLFNEKFAGFVSFAGLIASTWFTWHCYAHLPVKDFRPYAIGKNITEGMTLPPGAITDSVVMVFIYKDKTTGAQVEAGMDQVSQYSGNEKYEFVDRIDKVVREGDKAPIHDFAIKDAEDNDLTSDFLSRPDYVFMLIAYDLTKADVKAQDKVNALAAECQKNDFEFFGLTSTIPTETDKFRHDHQNMFPYYFCDGTALKTIIRSNPGLVLLKQGTVIDMWHHNDFPTYEELNAKYLHKK
ncbi:MAG: DoxX family membrane protein [Bacteroidetes bacterium]|nr:DoxX family membrane protein [Bacteroidota bacterium]